MPEAPEIKIITELLRQHIVGESFVMIDSYNGDKLIKRGDLNNLKEHILNKELKFVSRYGKIIMFEFDDHSRITIHLKMSGNLQIVKGSLPEFSKLAFSFNNSKMALCDQHAFSTIKLFSPDDKIIDIDKQGPDVFDDDISSRLVFEYCQSQKPSTTIHTLLQNQFMVAGIGNFYASEILHLAKIYPFIRANIINPMQVDNIIKSIKYIMKIAYANNGYARKGYCLPNGKQGSYESERLVYDREGLVCLTCKGATIKRKKETKPAFFCPACQAK